jgi:predicted permease
VNGASFDNLGSDLRYAARGLWRSPLFTIVALLTLAIGTGATTAVFSVVDGVLLKPLPYPHPEDLVAIWHNAPGASGLTDVSGGLRMSPSMQITYEEGNSSFEQIGMWIAGTASITGFAEPEQVPNVAIAGAVLPALGVPPLLGRWLDRSDEDPSGPQRVMLSYGYWQRRFGGASDVIGRNITVNAASAEIVGVMPEGFRVLETPADLITPLRFPRVGLVPPPFCCTGIARLKPGVTIAQANADLERLLPIWIDRFPFQNGGNAKATYLDSWMIAPAIRPLKQDVVGNVGNVLWVVMGTIGAVLLIACANVMNLLLVRAEKRRAELAVRGALGAGSWRIARALLIESALLGIAGGTAGLALATGGLALIKRLAPATLPRVDSIALDWRALVFTLAVSAIAGLVLGAIPAVSYAGSKINAALRAGGRGGTQGRAQYRAQNVLVVAQVALALVLVVSSVLMLRTFQALRAVEPGFTQPESLQTVSVAISPSLEPDPEKVTRMQNAILDAIEAIPSVGSAGFASSLPMQGVYGSWDGIDVEDQPRRNASDPFALRMYKNVSPKLFSTLGTRLVAGRELEWTDVYNDRPVALLSENLARELWNDASAAIGKRIRGGSGQGVWREIIGVVEDTHDNGLQAPAPTIAYWPSLMKGFNPGIGAASVPAPATVQRNLTIAIRSPLAGTDSFIRQVEQAVWSVSGDLPLASVQTMQSLYDRSLARTSFTLVMLGVAGAAALVLGVVGLYGVISYAVSQRRREIAIRLALGAQQNVVTRAFVRYGAGLAVVGVMIGLIAAAAVTRLMGTLLYGVPALDPLTYVAVALVLTLAAVLASWWSARRASRVDPAEALAAE